MSFVKEKIPEADLKRIDFSNVTDPLSNRPIFPSHEWTIDRDRDIALISLAVGLGKTPSTPTFSFFIGKGGLFK